MFRVVIKKKLKIQCPYFQRNVYNSAIGQNVPPLRLRYLQPVLLGTTSCASIFIAAAIIHEREKESLWKKLKTCKDTTVWSKLRQLITDDDLFNYDVWETRRRLLLEKKEQYQQSLNEALERYQMLPITVRNGILKTFESLLSMSEAERTISVMIALNVIIFGAWHVPRIQPLMSRYFVYNPTKEYYITLITSCFLHRQATHLALNMVGLWTVGPWVYDALGKEQFLALYLSLGIGSNTISHVAQLALYRRRPIIPLQGASGAIYGLLCGTAVMYPESAILTTFLPSIPIKISYVVPALVSLDIVGVLLRWRMFNHLSHLGGAALGAAYMQIGPDYIWPTLLQETRNIKKYFYGKKGNGGGGGDDTSGVLMEIPQKIRLKMLGGKAAVPEEQ